MQRSMVMVFTKLEKAKLNSGYLRLQRKTEVYEREDRGGFCSPCMPLSAKYFFSK